MNSGLPVPMAEGMMPNKATSKAQFRFFQAVKHGTAHAKGLSSSEAGEMLGHQSPKGLPEKASKRRHKVKFPSPKRK